MWTRLIHPNPEAMVFTSPSRNVAWWVARAVWTLLTGMHVWPAIMVLGRVVADPSLSGVMSWLSLLAVLALFCLKAVDVRWLRFRRPVLELLVMTVIAGIAHGDVVRHAQVPALPAETTTAVAAAVCLAALAHRRLRRFMHAFAFAAPRTGLPRIGTIAWIAWLIPQRAVQFASPPRAPPSMMC